MRYQMISIFSVRKEQENVAGNGSRNKTWSKMLHSCQNRHELAQWLYA